ncbi:hypothetical protein RJ639_035535 [Escallonia herrerae]|uniref:Uncharacterized protein n=1 Tax=Escallonia herrerae TaxID=1293975 RepID=A0AA88WRI6_9ASTE|nr:hypothetical protein RJ639_035535 [Escallonia herrerae]
MELGLECSQDIPKERMNIMEVVLKLNKIKLQQQDADDLSITFKTLCSTVQIGISSQQVPAKELF